MPKYMVEYETRDEGEVMVETDDEYSEEDEQSDMFLRDMADLVREKTGEHFSEIIVLSAQRA